MKSAEVLNIQHFTEDMDELALTPSEMAQDAENRIFEAAREASLT